MSEKEKNIEGNENQGTDNRIPIERAGSSENGQAADKSNGPDLSADLAAALDKSAQLEKQVAELRDALLRKVAEFENYKRRNENDQLNLLKYAAEPFIRNILPVFDDLERSLSHIDEEGKYESTKKGLQLVFEKFAKVLEGQGIKRIDAKGKPFDVEHHEALMQQPAPGVDPHTVLEVLEPGYLYKDKVIRHAKVIVSAETASHDGDSKIQEDNN